MAGIAVPQTLAPEGWVFVASINKGRRTEINDFAGQQDISGRVDRYRFSTRAFTLQDELEDAVGSYLTVKGVATPSGGLVMLVA